MNYSTLQTLTPPAPERRTQTVSPLSCVVWTTAKVKMLAHLTVVLIVALVLKSHYSTTSVNGLQWILAPTAFLVELVSGIRFTFESHAGYMNADNTFLIAASCSGVNFLIISFLVLALGEIWRRRDGNIGWSFIPVSMIAAYLTTIVANTARIDLALRTRQMDLGSDWLNPEEIHRLEGIVVYFGFLLLLFVVVEKVRGKANSASILRRLSLPLSIYYATTLGIPIVLGAYPESAFWEHSIFVTVTPVAMMLPVVFYHLLVVRGGKISVT